MPAAGEGTSTETLSVSSSQSISSWLTVSPAFLNQVETVASDTDSPKVGTITSILPPSVPPLLPLAGLADSDSVLLSSFFSAFFGAEAEPLSPSDRMASRASTPTVSPSCATISARVPAAGEGTSTVTLSVSSSHSISSASTVSPAFLNQVATVASVTDSPSVGTRTSVVITSYPSIVSAASTSASCWALCWLARPVAGEAEAERPA